MNIKKGIVAGLMVTVIGMTTLNIYAKDTQKETYESDIAICTTDNFELTFKEFIKDTDNISKEDYKKAETLFNKAISLEDQSFNYWDELYSLDLFDVEDFTFEDFSEDFKKDIQPDVKKKAKELFNKAIKLEEDGNYDDADKVWEELYSLDLFDLELIDGECLIDFEDFTFEDFSMDFKKDIQPEVKKKAEELFNKAIKLEEDSKYDDADKVWDELDSLDLFDVEFFDDVDLIDFEDFTCEDFTFEDFSQDFKNDAKKEDIEKAKDLFNKATELDKESFKVWDDLYEIIF